MRLLRITVLVGVLTALLASPVAATPKHSGCGNAASGWEAVTYQEWVNRTEQYDPANAPLPPETVAEIIAGVQSVDKNADGYVCWKEFQASIVGAWPPGFFQIADNHRAAGDQK